MGLFDTLTKGVAKITAATGNLILSGAEKVTGQTFGRADPNELLKNPIYKGLASSAVVVGGAAAGIASAQAIGSYGVANVAKSLIPSTIKGKAALGATSLVASGFVLNNPQQAAKTIVSTPTGLVNVGANIGQFTQNPSLSSGKKIISENPVLSTGLIAGAVVAGGLGVAGAANAFSNYSNTQALQENTKAVAQPVQAIPPVVYNTPKELPPQIIQIQQIPPPVSSGTTPILPAEVTARSTLSSSTAVVGGEITPKKKKKKKKKAKKKPKKKKKTKKKTKKKAKKKKKKTIKRRKTSK